MAKRQDDEGVATPPFPPPIPIAGKVIPIYIKAVPEDSSLLKVLQRVLSGELGCIGYDQVQEDLVLYARTPDGLSEVWGVMRMRGWDQ